MIKKLINKTPKIMQKLLSNKYVLYIVLVISIIHAVGYIQMDNWDALALYISGHILMSYFSKNMIINMLVAMFLGNCKVCADQMRSWREGFYEGAKNRDGTKKKSTKYYKNKDGNCVEHEQQTHKKRGCKGSGCKGKKCHSCYSNIKCAN